MEKFYQTDCESLWCQIKHKQKQIELKRRWLLGTPLSESDLNKFIYFGHDVLPESLLRDDDMFFETLKSSVEASYGARNVAAGGNHVFPTDGLVFDRKYICRALSSCLDDLTTKGLHLVATTITQGVVKFEETRWRMKKVIRGYLNKKFDDEPGVLEKLSHHLSDPDNFRDKFVSVSGSTLQSQRFAFRKVLDRLEDLPDEALAAMYRNLKEGEIHVPRLGMKKCKRYKLIPKLRRTLEKIISEPGTGDDLQGSLAKAMTIANLSLKLQPGFHNSVVPESHMFSQEVKLLQDDIASAIWLVGSKSKVSVPDLEYLKSLLDRDAKVSKRSLRFAIKKMLTEYLFMCGDMDTVPESLSEAVDFINKKSQTKLHRPTLINEVNEEVECVLNISAQTKQIVWDMFLHHELDLEFADAYVEEIMDEDSDEDDSDDDANHNQAFQPEQRTYESDRSHSDDSHYDDESIGDSRPFTSNLPTAKPVCGNSYGMERGFHATSSERHEPEHHTGNDIQEQLHVEPDDVSNQSTCNKYLAIQKVCDETSLIAHDLVGRMLEVYAKSEGLDLDWDDTLFSNGDSATQEDSEDRRQTSSGENKGSCVILNIIDELRMPLPESGIEALRCLLGK